MDLDLANGFVIGVHATRQMHHRGITREQIEAVLLAYHTSYPAEPLPRQREQSTVYVGTFAGRDLKVYTFKTTAIHRISGQSCGRERSRDETGTIR